MQSWLFAALMTAAILPAQTALALPTFAPETAFTMERVTLSAQRLPPQSHGPYTWKLLDQPPGSAVQLEAGSGPTTALTPQIDGVYHITVSGLSPDNKPVQSNIALHAIGDTLVLNSTLDKEAMQCLAVQASSLLNGASSVTVKSCDRGTTAQRWSLDPQGRLHSAINHDFCLDGGGSTGGTSPTVVPCDPRKGGAQLWEFAVQPVQNQSQPPPVALRNKGRSQVLESVNSSLRLAAVQGPASLWVRYRDDYKWVTNNENVNRKVVYPLSILNTKDIELELVRHRVNMLDSASFPLPILRDVSSFPGSVPSNAPLSAGVFELDRNMPNSDYLQMRAAPQNWLSTGMYARAAHAVTITIDNATEQQLAGVFVRIGVHIDNLTNASNVQQAKQLERFSIVTQRTPLHPGNNVVTSQYGGLVILESTVQANVKLQISISGAVAAPYFQRGKTELAWKQIRNNPAPWAELEGKRAIITVPSTEIRDLEDPSKVTDYYDKLVSAHEVLAGLAENDPNPLHHPPAGKHRFVVDWQISGGGAHSGFPLMFNKAQYHLTENVDPVDNWGIWHELGHNYQQYQLWGDCYGAEVTVNLFTLHAEQAFQDLYLKLPEDKRPRPNLERTNTYADVKVLLNNVANNNKWKGASDSKAYFVQLVFLEQIQRAYGWEKFVQLQRYYRTLPVAEIKAIKGDRALQLDRFFIEMSRITGHDLTDHFTKWNVPVSEDAKARVRELHLPQPTTPIWTLGPVEAAGSTLPPFLVGGVFVHGTQVIMNGKTFRMTVTYNGITDTHYAVAGARCAPESCTASRRFNSGGGVQAYWELAGPGTNGVPPSAPPPPSR